MNQAFNNVVLVTDFFTCPAGYIMKKGDMSSGLKPGPVSTESVALVAAAVSAAAEMAASTSATAPRDLMPFTTAAAEHKGCVCFMGYVILGKGEYHRDLLSFVTKGVSWGPCSGWMPFTTAAAEHEGCVLWGRD